MSTSDLRAALAAAANAAKIALDSARRLIVRCHKGGSRTSPLLAYHSLNGVIDSHIGLVDGVRPTLHRHSVAGEVQLGGIREASAIEASWEYARRVFLTAMSGLQCSYIEKQIESQSEVSFEEWSEKIACQTELHDAVIRDVIKTHYSPDELKAIRVMIDIQLDREVSRIFGELGIESPVSQTVGDGTGETVTTDELAMLVGRQSSTVSRQRRAKNGPDWKVDPMGREPGRMDFREAMDWAKTIWKTIDYPSNREELEKRIRQGHAS